MTKRPQGQPTKCTPGRVAIIAERVATGMPYKYACAAAGINDSTDRYWRIRGEKALEKAQGVIDDVPERERPYVTFLTAFGKANADFIESNLKVIRSCRDGRAKTDDDPGRAEQWQAAAWMNERRYPEEFGVRTRIDAHVTGTLSIDQADAARDKILERGGLAANSNGSTNGTG